MLRIILVIAAALFALTSCASYGDQITEIENGENGTKVETQDGREHYLRHGVDCDEGDRLWECATRDDLLVERESGPARAEQGDD
jgi:hypothetical protein